MAVESRRLGRRTPHIHRKEEWQQHTLRHPQNVQRCDQGCLADLRELLLATSTPRISQLAANWAMHHALQVQWALVRILFEEKR